MKILCVGMNYAAHNNEMRNSLLRKEPVIFAKPDTALLRTGHPFFVPDFAERFDHEAEVVVRICRLGKDIGERFAHRYYEEVTLGIDFTARDLQQRLRSESLPWEISKAFDGSAAVGEFVNKNELPDLQDLHFHLDIDGETRQVGHTADMLHTIDEIVAYCSRFFTLRMGDLIYTGTPAGVGPVHEGQVLTGWLEDRQVMKMRVK
jgi:2-keto-4-pentenoate hydratase/2-oxohepta-3-ene-1,7-dioic acid hydratase in catechol pathway